MHSYTRRHLAKLLFLNIPDDLIVPVDIIQSLRVSSWAPYCGGASLLESPHPAWPVLKDSPVRCPPTTLDECPRIILPTLLLRGNTLKNCTKHLLISKDSKGYDIKLYTLQIPSPNTIPNYNLHVIPFHTVFYLGNQAFGKIALLHGLPARLGQSARPVATPLQLMEA